MKNEILLNAVGKISDELVDDADITARSNKRNIPWKTFIASAACFCMIVTAFFLMSHFLPNNSVGNLPGVTNPSSPTVQGDIDDYVPYLSAYDVAGLFAYLNDRYETNVYTVEEYPKDYLAKILNVPDGNSVNIYNYLTAGVKPDEESVQSFSQKVFASLENSLETNIPDATFLKIDNHDGSFYYSSLIETEICAIIASQNNLMERVAVLREANKTDNALICNKTAIRIDPLISDDELLKQFVPTAQIINAAFGTNFNDIAIARSYDEYSPNGIDSIRIFLYNERDEMQDKIRELPLSDYILIEFFDMQSSGDGNEVDADAISYIHYRVPIGERLHLACEEPVLTLEQAEEMLEKGYVFGGHSCRLCMQTQEKVDFLEYDHVGFEYVMGETDGKGVQLWVPFYTFYKKLDTAQNGIERYAKTYVCAVSLTDIDSYFEMQAENHS